MSLPAALCIISHMVAVRRSAVMAIEAKVWDAAEVPNNPADIAAYLDAILKMERLKSCCRC